MIQEVAKTLDADTGNNNAKEAMDIVATKYAELLWELYWHKRRTGELPDPSKQRKPNQAAFSDDS